MLLANGFQYLRPNITVKVIISTDLNIHLFIEFITYMMSFDILHVYKCKN